MLRGGCLCGAVRYETNGTPFHQSNCHCSMCRRAAGAPYLAWFAVKRPDFRWVSGAPTLYQSSTHCRRGFCGHCGTQLTFEDDRQKEELDLTICSLDDPEAVPPTHDIYAATRLSWVAADGRESHPDTRPRKT